MADLKKEPDTRDDETKRLTSHLNSFTLPKSEEQEVEEALELKVPELPDGVKETLALLKEVQDSVVTSRAENAVKLHRINKITAHLHAIQQVEPAPQMTSKTSRKLAAVQSKNATAMQIESLGRQFPAVKDLADECKQLEQQNEELNSENETLKAEIETLKSKK